MLFRKRSDTGSKVNMVPKFGLVAALNVPMYGPIYVI